MNIITAKLVSGQKSTHIVTNLELLALINLYESAGIKYEIKRLVA